MKSVKDVGFGTFGPFIENELTAILNECFLEGAGPGSAPAYVFSLIVDGQTAGHVSLRISDSELIRWYAGHVGYTIEPAFRGRHYAARAVRLLAPVARFHAIDPLIITCNPENIASRHVAERLGQYALPLARLETVP